MCAQVLRFFPAYVGLRHALKRSGKVHSAIFRRRCAAPFWSTWLGDAKQSGGGTFDLLIHDVDMALHLFGKPRAISATGSEDIANGVDLITANFYYDDVPSVVITGGWHHMKSYPFSMEFTVVSDAATYDFNSSRGDEVGEYRKNGESLTMEQPKCDAYEAEIRYFVECALAGEPPTICPPQESAMAVKLTRLMIEARIAKRRESPMQPLEIGVIFWAGGDPQETLRNLKALGVKAGQLGLPGNYPLDGAAARWKQALAGEQFELATVVCAYTGEDYADIPTVERTVGFVPEATRHERVGADAGGERFRARAGGRQHCMPRRLRSAFPRRCGLHCGPGGGAPYLRSRRKLTDRPSRSKPDRNPPKCWAASSRTWAARTWPSISTRPT